MEINIIIISKLRNSNKKILLISKIVSILYYECELFKRLRVSQLILLCCLVWLGLALPVVIVVELTIGSMLMRLIRASVVEVLGLVVNHNHNSHSIKDRCIMSYLIELTIKVIRILILSKDMEEWRVVCRQPLH